MRILLTLFEENQKRKKIFQLLGLVGCVVIIYMILDLWIGEMFQLLFLGPASIALKSLSFGIPISKVFVFKETAICGLVIRSLIFLISLFIWSIPIFLYQRSNTIYKKTAACLLGIIIVAWQVSWNWISAFIWGDGLPFPSKVPFQLALFIFFSILGGVVYFYIGFAVFFNRIIRSKCCFSNVRKKLIQMLVLFGISTVFYIILDLWLGQKFQFIMSAPLIPKKYFWDESSHLYFMLRVPCFLIILCAWSYPILQFHITKNRFIKAVAFIGGIVIVIWYAFWYWIAVYGFKRQSSLEIEEPVRPVVYCGIVAFYLGFAGIFFIVLNIEKILILRRSGNLSPILKIKLLFNRLNKATQKKVQQALLLFGASSACYLTFDMILGEEFRSTFIAPVLPAIGSICCIWNDSAQYVLLRTLAFMVVQAVWVFPLFLFQTVRHVSLKIVCCLSIMAVAVWYAVMTCLSLLVWEQPMKWLENSVWYLFIMSGISTGLIIFYTGYIYIFFRKPK